MKIKRMIAIVSAMAIIATATGCSSTNENTDTTNTSTTASESTQSETTIDSTQVESNTKATAKTENVPDKAGDSIVYGKVTAIDGSTVTLAVGDIPQGNKMEGGQAPNKDDAQNVQESSTDQSKEAPNEKKEAPALDASQGNTEASSGKKQNQQPPSGEGEAPEMGLLFVESGESLTITIEDESLIKIMSGTDLITGSLSDIAVDSILSIEYDDSQNITEITVTLQP